MNPLAKLFLILSGAKVIALSEASYQFYKKIVGNRAFYLKTGIDTETFVPVDDKKKIEKDQKSMENLCPKLQKYDIIIR